MKPYPFASLNHFTFPSDIPTTSLRRQTHASRVRAPSGPARMRTLVSASREGRSKLFELKSPPACKIPAGPKGPSGFSVQRVDAAVRVVVTQDLADGLLRLGHADRAELAHSDTVAEPCAAEVKAT